MRSSCRQKAQCLLGGLRIGAERRAAGKPPGRFFEVDLSATQVEKRGLVARLVRTRPSLSEDNIIYSPCSFGKDELGTALRGAGFDASRPSISRSTKCKDESSL